MGLIIFILFAVVVVLLLRYFKKHGPSNRVDKTGWDPVEREALADLKRRLDTGDITQEEYDEKKKQIEHDS